MNILQYILASMFFVLLPSFVVADPQGSEEKKYDIFGFGNSIVDVIAMVGEEELAKLLPAEAKKGDMIYVDKPQLDSIHHQLANPTIIPSGSSANVMVDIASLGGKPAYSTLASNDSHGLLHKDSLIEAGVAYLSPLQNSEQPTATNLVLITPDGEPTSITHLGIAEAFNNEQIDYNAIKQSKIVYTEGSIWDHNGLRAQAALKALAIAKEAGSITAFNLHDTYYANEFRKEFIGLISKVDIVLSNEEEALTLFKAKTIEQVVRFYKKIAGVAVITQGARGALVVTKDKVIHVPALARPEEVIDTTGASDAFAAGFLFSYSQGKALEECAEIGAQAAAYIVKQFGPRPKDKLSSVLRHS